MNTQKLPVGIDNFEKLRKEDFYYVDKTGLIIDLMKTGERLTSSLARVGLAKL